MIHLAEHKQESEAVRIQLISPPAKAYIPLSQHIGRPCLPLVKAGDSVAAGQQIATALANIFAPVHSSISGKVSAVEDWPHPVLGRCKAIVIENDGQGRLQPRGTRTQEEADNLTPEQIRAAVFEAGVVGMGGASFPTHIKLNPPREVDSLIINGAECEPYLTSDYRLMLEKTKEICLGIGLIVRCTGAKRVFIAIEDNKPEAIKKFEANDRGYIVKVLKSQYPQGGEKQLVKSVLRREVPSGKLPFEVGALVQNVATVYAVYEAVYLSKPLYERVVTVAGDCIKNPANLLVPVGTPFGELIAYCGGFIRQPEKLISGGPMMGVAQYSLQAPVVKSTNGIVALSASLASAQGKAVCIRCSRCVSYCPVGLMPCMISMAAEYQKWDLAGDYGCLDCMECGLCNYVCPQLRNNLQAIKQAKAKMPR